MKVPTITSVINFFPTTVISWIACVRGWRAGGVGGGSGWEAGGGLYILIGLFETSMGPRSASYRPRQAWKA